MKKIANECIISMEKIRNSSRIIKYQVLKKCSILFFSDAGYGWCTREVQNTSTSCMVTSTKCLPKVTASQTLMSNSERLSVLQNSCWKLNRYVSVFILNRVDFTFLHITLENLVYNSPYINDRCKFQNN